MSLRGTERRYFDGDQHAVQYCSDGIAYIGCYNSDELLWIRTVLCFASRIYRFNLENASANALLIGSFASFACFFIY